MLISLFRLEYFYILLAFISVTSCGITHPTSKKPGKVSLTTGTPFNRADTLRVVPFQGESFISGMVYVEGGYMMMGNLGEDRLGTGGRYAKPATVTSFYMDKTPITNLDYREYLDDLQRNGLIEQCKAAMPDQEVWVQGFSYNDPYVENYLTSPGFMYYPVVGVTWDQAIAYCKWRTAKVCDKIKQREVKLLKSTDNNLNDDNDATTRVLGGQGDVKEAIALSLPVFRLPTEAEWEYAARGVVGVAGVNYLQSHQRIYPWPGSALRGKDGKFLANFKRGKGNYKGMAGESNSAAPTSSVYDYPPNDLGLYDMVGNVCCWVNDTYRPLSLQDTNDLNPMRRDGLLDDASSYDTLNKTSLVSDYAKVYKGCSWSDCAYFLQVGTRRFLNKDNATATIGFRCVVSSLGG